MHLANSGMICPRMLHPSVVRPLTLAPALHPRAQPLILEPEDWAAWLDPANQDLDDVRRLLAFERPGRFEAYPITTAVNATRNNGPQLLDPAPESELQGVVDPMTGEVIGG